MGDAVVDDVKLALSEQDLEPKCPNCGSRLLYACYTREYRVDLETDVSSETMDSDLNPTKISCSCGWSIDV